MSLPTPLKDARIAVSLLTVLPVGVESSSPDGSGTAAWFPMVGLGLGAIGYGLAQAAIWLHVETRSPYLVATVIVVTWALCTRALHWDGLADVADGFWGSEDQARRLEIMSDSSVGAFGATAVALIALLEVTAIGSILQSSHELSLLAVPVLARFSATAAAWFGAPARPGGLGRSVMGRPHPGGVVIAVVPLALAFALMSLAFGLKGDVFMSAGLLVAMGVPYLIARRFGGVTGDVMGASVLVTETLLFVALALGAR